MLATERVDFEIEKQGTIFLLHPYTDEARDWLSENIADSAMYWGDATVVEHRCIESIVDGIRVDGLTVK